MPPPPTPDPPSHGRPDPANDHLWQQIASAITRRQPLIVASIVRDSGSVPRRTGAKMVVFPDGTTQGSVGGGLFEMLVIRDAQAALRGGHCATRRYSFNPTHTAPDAFGAICGGAAEVFMEVIMPPDRLLIVGGGHCGRALAEAAALLGFSMVIVDDRADYARDADFPFPGVEQVLRAGPDFAALPAVDAQTYVVLVTKGFATDEAALRRVIDSPATYIGMIGSLKKRDHVFANLRASGIPEDKLACVHSPVGLEIGADTPAEIAISILAEIIQVRARRRAETMPLPKDATTDVTDARH